MFPWQQLPAKETERKKKSKLNANETKSIIKPAVKKGRSSHSKHCFSGITTTGEI